MLKEVVALATKKVLKWRVTHSKSSRVVFEDILLRKRTKCPCLYFVVGMRCVTWVGGAPPLPPFRDIFTQCQGGREERGRKKATVGRDR